VIKVVLFDLYETLITEWQGDKKKATYSTDMLDMEPKRFKQEWDRRREQRMDGTFADHQSVLIDILNMQGKEADGDILAYIHEERVRCKKVPFQEMHPEVIDMLKQLKASGLKLGLISNCAPEEVMAWKTSELADYFDTVIFSYEVKCAKPHPEIYHLACEKLGVKPEESIFIGDGGSDELNGARRAGIEAFQAAWFIPSHMSEKNTDFPKLESPFDVLTHLKLLSKA
jgi:putative hydrolase of the HAD superfamily